MWLIQLADAGILLNLTDHSPKKSKASTKKRKASTGQPADGQSRAKRTAPQLQQPHPGNDIEATQKQVEIGGTTTQYAFV